MSIESIFTVIKLGDICHSNCGIVSLQETNEKNPAVETNCTDSMHSYGIILFNCHIQLNVFVSIAMAYASAFMPRVADIFV